MASPLTSTKPYGKIDEADEASRLAARQKTRKRLVILAVSSVFLVAIVVGAVVGAVDSRSSGSSNPADSGDGGGPRSPSASVKAVCSATPYPTPCYRSLYPLVNSSGTFPVDPAKLLQLSIQVALNAAAKASKHLDVGGDELDKMSSAALANCRELLGLAVDQLNETMAPAADLMTSAPVVVDDLKTWLSSSVTHLQTCIDGFDEGGYVDMRNRVAGSLKNSTELTRNSLAILTAISSFVDSLGLQTRRRRRLMSYQYPGWLLPSSRRLLESSEDPRPKADVVVAKDGKGDYKTVAEAVAAAPEKSKKRFIIYVKKGVYTENVEVGKKKWNVMLVGDGMDATVISGSLNFVDGTPTYSTATFAAMGKGFIARDVGFENTAGAAKQQAVAMRSGADQSVFYRCRFDGYQDTLYAHSLRQFYRDCEISGTVDFIFGNAAAVFQRCNIYPRVPLPGQQDTVTAQGKVDPNQNTGFSIHNCSLLRPAGADVNVAAAAAAVKVYLGRPWKPYSTTVFMSTEMGDIVDPAGWLPWNGTTAPDTIFYGEYRNTGPGAETKGRVKWKGLRFLTASQAKKFTVGSFFGGKSWIEKAGAPYTPGL